MSISKISKDFEFTPLPVGQAVNWMIIPGVGIQASDWDAFKDAIFGRDTLRFIRDLMPQPQYQDAIKLGLTSLARLQARQPQADNPLLDATLGGIHHEARLLYINGQRIGPEQEVRLKWLAKAWGGDDTGVVYYGTTDATPDFVTAIAEYIQTYGSGILTETFVHELTGETRSFQDAFISAVEWVEHRIESSPLGLVESHRTNPRGLPYPFWRDGRDGYRLPDGELVNARQPIASFEIQAKAFDALVTAAKVLADTQPKRAEHWQSMALRLRHNIISQFWMPEHHYFAMAIDRDPRTNRPRRIETVSSLPSEALDSGLWQEFPDTERQMYLTAIVKTTYSANLLSQIGIRCLNVDMQQFMDWYCYQGPTSVWTVSNNVIAIGLRRYGFIRLAEDLENRSLNALNIAGNFYEFLEALPDGRVAYDPLGKRQLDVPRQELMSRCKPEHIQAWTASAVARIIWDRQHTPKASLLEWQAQLELRLLEQNPSVPLIESLAALERAFPRHYGFANNVEEALRRRQREAIGQGYSDYLQMV